MDIAGLSTNLSTINVVTDVQVAVLRQSLDTLETSGDSLTKMMESLGIHHTPNTHLLIRSEYF